jgi:hypothetical protein
VSCPRIWLQNFALKFLRFFRNYVTRLGSTSSPRSGSSDGTQPAVALLTPSRNARLMGIEDFLVGGDLLAIGSRFLGRRMIRIDGWRRAVELKSDEIAKSILRPSCSTLSVDSSGSIAVPRAAGSGALQPPDKCMTTPVAAPMNSKRHAVDWMKKPGNRFSTALL